MTTPGKRTSTNSHKTVIHGERLLYDSAWVRLSLIDISTPDGRRFESHAVKLRPVAIAAVVDADDRVLMLWRHRFLTDSWGWELPGGLIEPGEDAAVTASRETVEETGWRPLALRPVLSFQPAPGMVEMPYELFIADGAERVGDPTDLEEAGVVGWVPMADVLSFAERGELLGSGTLVALLYLLAKRRSQIADPGLDINVVEPTAEADGASAQGEVLG